MTQLINSTHGWSETLNEKGQTCVMLLDFSQAFDKVINHHLSDKLNYYGISSNTQGWINSFLSHRKLLVSVKLNYYGILNNTHGWINSFLSQRKQLVSVKLNYYGISNNTKAGLTAAFPNVNNQFHLRALTLPGLLLHRVSPRILLFINDIKKHI